MVGSVLAIEGGESTIAGPVVNWGPSMSAVRTVEEGRARIDGIIGEVGGFLT